jgi:hypothetical protein
MVVVGYPFGGTIGKNGNGNPNQQKGDRLLNVFALTLKKRLGKCSKMEKNHPVCFQKSVFYMREKMCDFFQQTCPGESRDGGGLTAMLAIFQFSLITAIQTNS